MTNPLASDDITAVRMSNGDSTGTAVGKLGVIYDSLS